jgi:hypothetical protein
MYSRGHIDNTSFDPAKDSQQHSPLAGGHFDTIRSIESSGASAKISHYHGVPVLKWPGDDAGMTRQCENKG